MKILSIYFKNINSLQGENRIHFDQVPLSESGVFAITGPNGSGKSSIWTLLLWLCTEKHSVLTGRLIM